MPKFKEGDIVLFDDCWICKIKRVLDYGEYLLKGNSVTFYESITSVDESGKLATKAEIILYGGDFKWIF